MMNNKEFTNLQKANSYFRAGDYSSALEYYSKITEQQPELTSLVEVNIALCKSRMGVEYSAASEFSQTDVQMKVCAEDIHSLYLEAFDIEFYLKRYPDIVSSGTDPFAHYSTWGWREGRLPNSWFDPVYYLEKYDDVKESGLEPLLHYVRLGVHEKRKTKEFSISAVSESVKANIQKIKFDDVSEGFVEYKENVKISPGVKLLAFYLPQFHPFPENDTWWGKGFTEWTNVTKAQPNFSGHYQPHYPIHNGYYDLRVPEVMAEQAELAKNYGIHGFNFYYYWFDGKVLMHRPFEILLKHKEIDINFCITWANENWTRRWDGAENDVLIGQNHCEEDSIKFIEHMFQYFNDSRYIRINNKPVLIVYRANIIPDMAATISLWRRKVEQAGFDGIYVIGAQTFGFKDPKEYGFDAAMEFPPHTVKSNRINDTLEITNEKFEGNIYSYDEVVKNSCMQPRVDYKKYRTAMLSWDNTARKQNASHIFANFTMLKYKQWLSNITHQVFNDDHFNDDEKIVFVNAWNEWAEGTHLEPDRRKGYSYLQTTFDVLKEFDASNSKALGKKIINKTHSHAVVIHIHYTEVWFDILKYLENMNGIGFDLYVTITNVSNNIVGNILCSFPDAQITLVENRGRDIRPFIEVYRQIRNFGYSAVCKVHSKKSVYREDGDKIRDEIFDALLGSENRIAEIVQMLNNDENKVGLITLDKYLIKHSDKNMMYDRDIVYSLAELLEIEFEFSVFPAGSMYWFRPEALNGIDIIQDHLFEPEEGLADGTLAHGIERILHTVVCSNGFNSSVVPGV
jgi:lipopolysaccharide biosynthesis protein